MPNSLSHPTAEQLEADWELLCQTGEQSSDEDRRQARRILPGVHMAADGQPAQYDDRVVPVLPHMVVPSRSVHAALASIRPDALTTATADAFLEQRLDTDGLIVGFSGYGTEGHRYYTEASGIDQVLHACELRRMPVQCVVDGGTGYGVPGLAGVTGTMRRHETVGFAPLRSLRSAAWRDEYVVVGQEWGDEAEALGGLPDLLVALGGDQNARREVHAALAAGSIVMLANLTSYPERSLANDYVRPDTPVREAYVDGQLKVCKSRGEISRAIAGLDLDALLQRRENRLNHLRTVLAPTH